MSVPIPNLDSEWESNAAQDVVARQIVRHLKCLDLDGLLPELRHVLFLMINWLLSPKLGFDPALLLVHQLLL